MASIPPPSPLDSLLVLFLQHVDAQASGLVAGAVAYRRAGEALELSESLVEALFVSARTRGLVGPDFNARGRTRWIVSAKGHDFLDRHTG